MSRFVAAVFVAALARSFAASASRFIPASAFLLAPLDRWSPRSFVNGTAFLTKWGSSTAVIASPVNATAPPHPTALGLVYGMCASCGYARVSVNGAIVTELDTFNTSTTYDNELVIELKRPIISLPLWVLAFEATGTWRPGSKDSYVEVVGLNVYY